MNLTLDLHKRILLSSHAPRSLARSYHHANLPDGLLHELVSFLFILAGFEIILQAEPGARNRYQGKCTHNRGDWIRPVEKCKTGSDTEYHDKRRAKDHK